MMTMTYSNDLNRHEAIRSDPPGNVFLIGFMGCGKSTVGPIMARMDGREFADTDDMIEQTEKMPVSKIIGDYGEPHFRALEAKTIERACSAQNLVVSTGGGVVLNMENIFRMRGSGTVVWLNCPSEIIYNRIKNDSTRPLLRAKNKLFKMQEILTDRELIYRRAAHVIVNCGDKSPSKIAREAWDLVRQRGSQL
jgi:shikimate kinase